MSGTTIQEGSTSSAAAADLTTIRLVKSIASSYALQRHQSPYGPPTPSEPKLKPRPNESAMSLTLRSSRSSSWSQFKSFDRLIGLNSYHHHQNQGEERILCYPRWIEPVHCVGGCTNDRNRNRNRFGVPRVKESEDDIPFCNCAGNFRDQSQDGRKEPKVNPCASLKFRLCAPPDTFVPIPFVKPQSTFKDFTVPDEWKVQQQEEPATETEAGCDCVTEGEEPGSEFPEKAEGKTNPFAINYDAIGDVDDYCVDRNVIKLCPQVTNFTPTPFNCPKAVFNDFHCLPAPIGPNKSSKEGQGEDQGDCDGGSSLNSSATSKCQACIRELHEELRRRGTVTDRCTAHFCGQFKKAALRSSCKETFDDFVARKRWEAQLEEMARVQAEKDAAEAAAAKAQCANSNKADESDCFCDCPDDMECDFEDTAEDCLLDLEMNAGDGDLCPPDESEDVLLCATGPEPIPAPCDCPYSCASECSTHSGTGLPCHEEGQGRGDDEQLSIDGIPDCGGCGICCEEPTVCQQKIFDLQAKLLVSEATHENQLLKKELTFCKEKIRGYQNTISKVQCRLKEFQEKQKDHLKKKCNCIKRKEAEKLAIQRELEACRSQIAQSQKHMQAYKEKEHKLQQQGSSRVDRRSTPTGSPCRRTSSELIRSRSQESVAGGPVQNGRSAVLPSPCYDSTTAMSPATPCGRVKGQGQQGTNSASWARQSGKSLSPSKPGGRKPLEMSRTCSQFKVGGETGNGSGISSKILIGVLNKQSTNSCSAGKNCASKCQTQGRIVSPLAGGVAPANFGGNKLCAKSSQIPVRVSTLPSNYDGQCQGQSQGQQPRPLRQDQGEGNCGGSSQLPVGSSARRPNTGSLDNGTVTYNNNSSKSRPCSRQ